MNTFLKVLLFSVLALVLGLILSWLTVEKTPPPADLPWQIDKTADGSIRVFQTQLGVTTLGEFIHHYKQLPEVTLFVPRTGDSVIEAYFNSLMLAGLKAKVVLLLNVDKPTLEAMYDRGIRISTMGSGTRKVELSSEDIQTLRTMTISAITYIPSINITDALLQKRFGEPAYKLDDVNTHAVHWIYPEKGLDVALSDNDKDVFQYVHPGEINKVIDPLMQQQAPLPNQQ